MLHVHTQTRSFRSPRHNLYQFKEALVANNLRMHFCLKVGFYCLTTASLKPMYYLQQLSFTTWCIDSNSSCMREKAFYEHAQHNHSNVFTCLFTRGVYFSKVLVTDTFAILGTWGVRCAALFFDISLSASSCSWSIRTKLYDNMPSIYLLGRYYDY